MKDHEIKRLELIANLKYEIGRLEVYKELLSEKDFLKKYGTEGEKLLRDRLENLEE